MPALLPTLTVVLSAAVIVTDLYARRVPNVWLLIALVFGAGIILIGPIQSTSGSPWPALLGLLIGLAALLPMHAFGWMGAGDVKFFAVLGFLLGAKALLPIWVIASLIAGANSVIILLSRHWLVRTTPSGRSAQSWFFTSLFGQRVAAARQGRRGLPYAAWLGVGALITVFNPELMHW